MEQTDKGEVIILVRVKYKVTLLPGIVAKLGVSKLGLV